MPGLFAVRVVFGACVVLCLMAHSARALTLVSGNINLSTTWGATGFPADTLYRVTGTITINIISSLRIQPGTHIMFDPGTAIELQGSGSSSPSLIAIGQGNMPIVFSATNGLRGGWRGISFYEANASLSHCIFRDGGESGHPQIRIDALVPSISISNSVFEHFAAPGIENLIRVNAGVTIFGCTFRDYEGFPVSSTLPHAQGVFSSNTFVASPTHSAVGLRGEGPYGGPWGNLTLATPPPGFCYVAQSGSIGIPHADGSLRTLPGTLVKIPSGSEVIGDLRSTGTVFTSASDDTLGDTFGDGPTVGAPGDWRGIHLAEGGTLDGCIVRFGGEVATFGLQSLVMEGGSATNTVIEKGAGIGVVIESAPTFTGNIVRDHTGYPISATARWYQLNLASNTFEGLASGAGRGYQLVEGGNSPVVLPLPAPGFCYVGGFLPLTHTLEIQPGTVFKFGPDAQIVLTSGGILSANDVLFTSLADDTLGDTGNDGPTSGAPGDWIGLDVGSSAPSTVSSCRIRFAGQDHFASLTVGQTAFVTGCRVEKGLGPALRAYPQRITALVAANNLVASPPGSCNAYEIAGGAPGVISSDLTLPAPAAPFCYFAKDPIRVEGASSPTLRFGDGSVIKFNFSGEIRIGENAAGKLIAEGVTFTSIQDDAVIGDTGGDGPTVGAPGQWKAITFFPSDAGSILRCSSVRYGGSAIAALVINASTPLIQNCTIAGATIGAYSTSTEHAPVFIGCTFTTSTGVYLTAGSPQIALCDFSGTANAVVAFADMQVHAENCWWGSASGPYDGSHGPPDYNPLGTGAEVTDGVFYRPWADAAPAVTCPTTTGVTPPGPIAVGRLAMLGLSPNPGQPPWRIRFAAHQAGTARLDVFDISGRRVGGRDFEVDAAGEQEAELALSSALRPGIYAVSVRLAGQVARTRAVFVR